MAQHKGKKAVIISDIKSDSIEQAIFILRSTAVSPVYKSKKQNLPGKGIVSEAQEIINNYIKATESPKSFRKNLSGKLITLISALLATAAATVSVIIYFL